MKDFKEFLTESKEELNEAKVTTKKLHTSASKLSDQLDAFSSLIEDYENDERTLDGKQKDIPVKTIKEFSDLREKTKKVLKDIGRV